MDNKPDKSNRTLILYFALSVIFAALSILASRVITVTYFRSYATITINMKWMFWLSAALSVVFILPLVRFILYAFHQQGRLPKALGWFFRDEVSEKVVSAIRSFQFFMMSTLGRLILAGLGILLVTIAVWRSGVIHEMETNTNLLMLADAARGQHPGMKLTVDSTVETCTYFRPQSGTYLRDCLKLVTDLKAIGVKVVVIALRPPLGTQDESDVIRKLEETGIVVFATDYGRTLRIVDSKGELKLSAGSFTMFENEVEETADRLVRLRPTGIENVGSPRLLDIAIEILRKYKGYGNEIPWSEEKGEFRFGEYAIPVTRDGWMYSSNRGFRLSSLFYVDSARSWYIPNRPKSSESFSQKAVKAGLKVEDERIPVRDAGNQLHGKIVLFIDSFGLPGSYVLSRAYQSSIQNILSGALIRKWEMGHLWLSVLCLLIAGLIIYHVRLIVAMLILLAFLPCVLLFGSYLYTSYSILIDMFYPFLSTAMAIVVFPIIVLGCQSDLRKETFV